MITCPKCNAQVDDPGTYCDNCGFRLPPTDPQPLPGIAAPSLNDMGQLLDGTVESGSYTRAICSACGYANIPGEMFCQKCGVQLAPVASIPPPPPIPVPTDGSSFIPSYQRAKVENDLNQGGQGSMLSIVEQKNSISGKLVIQDSRAEITLPSGKTELTVGRSDPIRGIFPDIDLADFGGEKAGISRLHARFLLLDSQIYLEDLNSTNFSFVNDLKLQGGQRTLLNPGDKLRLGLLALVYLTN
jgi:pSer/pThr/pTyr-binding forkhead associated (FHA) protein